MTTTIVAAVLCAASSTTVYEATLGGSESSGEISTAQMKEILEKKTATVFDSRPAREYAVGHIPGRLRKVSLSRT